MLSLSRLGSTKIFVCLVPADMRRSFDGLARMALDVAGEDPLSGHLFVFRNKRGDRIKILYWDGDGYALWYKRLEAGVFGFPPAGGDGRIEWSAAELMLMLEGIEVRGMKRRKRYERGAQDNAA